jgi:nucleolar protein 15
MVKEIKATKKTLSAKRSKNSSLKKRQISKRFDKLKIKPADLTNKGVVYVGHLPKGFNEKELRGFFEQFGKVTKLRVSRSAKVKYISSYIIDGLDCKIKRICIR